MVIEIYIIDMKDNKIIIGITQGDINGIGYEVIIKTLSDSRLMEMFVPVIYGSSKVLAYHRKAINAPNLALNNIKTIKELHSKQINIFNCVDENIKVELGQSTDIAGEASFAALEAAKQDLLNGDIDVLVTAPINKNNIQSAGFEFPGHTEYLEANFQGKALMLMVADDLKVATVTGHTSLGDVKEKLTAELLKSKAVALERSLIQDFGIRKPKIAVLGLNPHAGDGGVIGNEEQEVIIPVIEDLKSRGKVFVGPFGADGFFGSGAYKKFDAVLAMYHDQGLIPFKIMGMDKGVNYTAGLSIVRTSPAHGTAFDITGQNIASETSFREAIYLAIDIYRKRALYDEINKNPLRKQNAPNQYSGPDLSVDQLEDIETVNEPIRD